MKCRKCLQDKEVKQFGVYKVVNGVEYRRLVCSSCRLVIAKEAKKKLVGKAFPDSKKQCRECGELKPFSQFEPGRGKCDDCRRSYFRKKAISSKETIRRASEWNKNNPEAHRKASLSYYYKIQDQAIKAYGGYKCSCCGETEPLFLALDHINNDGKDHRKKIGTMGGAKLYKWLRDNNYPEGFQVLCSNCNHGKYRNGGICPHKQGVTTSRKA